MQKKGEKKLKIPPLPKSNTVNVANVHKDAETESSCAGSSPTMQHSSSDSSKINTGLKAERLIKYLVLEKI